ncbi:MAG: M23 family metallopeptidase [candidate division Zixibacteria bacterium]|nr:M23 family metallopeptidase [candidate division Zixibacteria bacterium]
MIKLLFCLAWFLAIPQIIFAEEEHFLPLKENKGISSIFADHRSFHFHSGIDFKTGEKTGLEVFAVKSGWVYRLVASWWGYGKAVYLKHPDGKLTVYAHLSEFSEKLKKLVTETQVQNKKYKTDIFLEEKIQIEKGELIGYSGESGTGDPHLHFELRDENNRLLNPLTNGVTIQDTIPPVLQSILLRPLNINSYVDGSEDYKIYPLSFDSKGGIFRLKEVPVVEGRIGVEVLVFDKMEERGNRFGIYRIELYRDTVLVFSSKYDCFDFENTWKVELDRDFELLRKDKIEFYKLYLDKGNDLPLYYTFNQGVLDFEKDTLYQFNILAQDASSNFSRAKILIRNAKKPEVSELFLQKDESEYIIGGKLKGNGKIKKITVEVSPLDGISWSKLSHSKPENSPNGFKIQLDDLPEEPGILRIKVGDEQSIESDYAYLLHRLDEISAKKKQNKLNPEIEFYLKDSNWIFRISFNQILKNTPEVFLQSGNQRILPLSTRQVNEKSYDFIFPYSESYFPGVLLDIMATDVSGSDKREVKYVDIFAAKGSVETMVESLDGEAKVEITPGSVSKMIGLKIEKLEKPEKRNQDLKSALYSFHPATYPLAKPARVSISYKGKDCNPFKTGLYKFEDDTFTFTGQEIDTLNGFISGKTRYFSSYILLEDLKTPEISKVFPGSGQQIKSKDLIISTRIKDDLSGIGNEQDIEVFLDGEWLIAEYDPEKYILISRPLGITEAGWHEVVIKAKDRMGNEKVVRNKFKIVE